MITSRAFSSSTSNKVVRNPMIVTLPALRLEVLPRYQSLKKEIEILQENAKKKEDDSGRTLDKRSFNQAKNYLPTSQQHLSHQVINLAHHG